ncbi:GNAT family N-acetyltransferase [Streptomyces sp. J2-1]|uniref:GNAT family N-acetyltransferase n=1 Tax=Streptomyces corallincola TaxID=2851888 RepID=UPI001C3908FC|nr:GNAT family N-acetyltransferase [Streptomyces corallincola]MBV2357152.1 GNAT family N-acetyltransferase [Streptomyces corallincola]
MIIDTPRTSLEWRGDPEEFHRLHAPELARIGADAFGRSVEVMAEEVEKRFGRSFAAQIIHADGRIAGFCLYDRIPGDSGLWSIEGRATLTAYQGMGLGALALARFLEVTGAETVVSVTRNPAVCRLMARRFTVCLPDLDPAAADPLRPLEHSAVRDAVKRYADHLDAADNPLPFLENRYPGGLYGAADPGRAMPFPELAGHPANGMITVGTNRPDV